jgi:hypothetical protein
MPARVHHRNAVVAVPSACEIRIGAPLRWGGDRVELMRALADRLERLGREAPARLGDCAPPGDGLGDGPIDRVKHARSPFFRNLASSITP